MAFGPRRSDFIEAVRFATIVLSFGMVGYVVFFNLLTAAKVSNGPRYHARNGRQSSDRIVHNFLGRNDGGGVRSRLVPGNVSQRSTPASSGSAHATTARSTQSGQVTPRAAQTRKIGRQH
jgi:hypothetical protein